MLIESNTIRSKFVGESDLDTIRVGFAEDSIAHFFSMIANLYSDPVTAVLRELGANCVDAIKEGGKDSVVAGWELHLPSRMNSTVRFIDNGAGLSPERMKEVYAIMGGSTKRNDANQIGGFGVGRFSIFSIVKTSNVISRHNGKKTQYFLFLQPNGLPDIKTISVQDTTERNGLEVNFTIHEKYISQFQAKYRQVYNYFDIRPKVFIGDIEQTEWNENKEPTLKGEGWHLNFGSSTVVMGGVQYALPQSSVVETPLKKFAAITEYGITIFADIGEYSVTPSREAIRFDDKTISRLASRLQQIQSSLEPIVQDKIKNAKNLYDAKRTLVELKRSMPFLQGVKVNINGIQIDDTDIKINFTKDNPGKVTRVYKESYYKRKIRRDDTPSIVHVDTSSEVLILVNDCKRGFVSRLIEYANQTNANTSRYSRSSVVAYFIDPNHEDEFRKETNWFGDIPKASSVLPKVESTSTNSSSRNYKGGELFVYSGKSYGHKSSHLAKFDIANSNFVKGASVIVFPINNAAAHGEYDVNTFNNLFVRIANFSKQPLTAIYIHQSKFNDLDVEELSEMLGVKVYKYNDWAKDNSKILQKYCEACINCGSLIGMFYTNSSINAKLPNSVMRLIKKRAIVVNKGAWREDPTSESEEKYREVFRVFQVKCNNKKNTKRFKMVEKLVKNIQNSFPILKLISLPTVGDTASKEIIDYINMAHSVKKS